MSIHHTTPHRQIYIFLLLINSMAGLINQSPPTASDLSQYKKLENPPKYQLF